MADEEKRRWKTRGVPSDKKSAGRTAKKKTPAYNARTESSKRWIERQMADPYVRKSKAEGYRSRAAYKLLELDERFNLLRSGIRVADLGAAPGGWVQIALQKGAKQVVGIDLLEMEPIMGAELLIGDIDDDDDRNLLIERLGGAPDVVLSDMAANTTGHKQTDHLRTVALVESAVDFAISQLAPGGHFCSKVFQGGATSAVLEALKTNFAEVKHAKPPASRSSSPEIYVMAKGFKGRRSQS